MTCLICHVSYKTGYLTGWSYILNCILTLSAIILNSIEIHILRKRRDKKPYEKMLLSLSTCDLSYQLSDFIFLSIIAYAVVKDDYTLSSTLWLAWGCICVLMAVISLLNLIFISVDRVWAVTAPFHHLSFVSGRKVLAAIVIAWCLPLLMLTLFIIQIIQSDSSIERINYITKEPTKVLAAFMLATHIAFLISSTVTIWTVFKSKSAQALTSSCPLTSQKPFISHNLSQQSHCLIICVGTILSFIVSSSPFIISQLVTWNTPLWLEDLGYTMFSFNAVLNSAIFLIQNYRNEKRKMKSRKSTTQELIIENKLKESAV